MCFIKKRIKYKRYVFNKQIEVKFILQPRPFWQ
jgi:hypothetical protein